MSTLRRTSLRTVLAWCALSATGYLLVRPLLTAFIPMMQVMIDTMQSDYMAHLSIVDVQGNARLLMSCTAARPLLFPNGHMIALFGTVDCAYIDAVHALVPIIIFLVAVVGWPIGNSVERRRRILASLLMLPLVVALTTPIALVGLEKMARNPDRFGGADGQLTSLMQPFVLMEMGGRWLLPLVAALVCIRLALPTSPGAPVSMIIQLFMAIRRKLTRYYLRAFY